MPKITDCLKTENRLKTAESVLNAESVNEKLGTCFFTNRNLHKRHNSLQNYFLIVIFQKIK